MFQLRLPSFNALEPELEQDMKKLIDTDRDRIASADALGYSLKRFDLVALQGQLFKINQQAKRNKVLAGRQRIRDQILGRVLTNRRHLLGRLRPSKLCRCLDAEGGWYAVLRVPRTRSEEDWVLELLDRDGVLVHPGYFFAFESEAYLAVSLLLPSEVFREGIDRLLARVES